MGGGGPNPEGKHMGGSTSQHQLEGNPQVRVTASGPQQSLFRGGVPHRITISLFIDP